LKAGIPRIADKLGARLSNIHAQTAAQEPQLRLETDASLLSRQAEGAGFSNGQGASGQDASRLRHRRSRFLPDLFDGADFSLIPCVPYDWQLRGETLEIPSVHSQRLNVLGFLNLNGSFESYVFEGSIDSEVLIKCFDDYCQRMKKPALIVLDNAPVHKSAAFESRIESWEEQGLYLLFLPPYCPELNKPRQTLVCRTFLESPTVSPAKQSPFTPRTLGILFALVFAESCG
jgi:hypothetical protein